jgi:hypothetical protein
MTSAIKEANEDLSVFAQSQVPEKIGIDDCASIDKRRLAGLLNELVGCVREIYACIVPLSQSKTNANTPLHPHHFFSSPVKELHSRLLHLTRQANQSALGDYQQRVDFMGEFFDAFNTMIISLDHHENALKTKIAELEQALSHISQLEGILPICSHCKRIRREGTDPRQQSNWESIESYITEKTQALFSHGICPECLKLLYSDQIK